MKVLVHYSKHPMGQLLRWPETPANAHKPGGLWLSDEAEYGWNKFLKDRIASGNPEWSDVRWQWKYTTVYEAGIQEILWLKSTADLNWFTEKYGESNHRNCGDGCGLHIEWGRVKAGYKGILISPYQEHLSHRRGDRMFHWYRFDCASACVWDSSCLTPCGESVKSTWWVD